jgi:tetratricopeptide (TPR) repeat protein
MAVALVAPAPGAQTAAPTEKECREFAAKLEAALKEGDGAFLDQSLDMDAILGAAAEGLEVDAATRALFENGLRGTFRPGEKIQQITRGTGSYRLLRLHEFGGRPCALFRLVGDSSGVVYHELALAATAAGRLVITDIYVLNTGEWISATFRRGLLAMAQQAQSGALDKLSGWENDFVKNLDNLQAIRLLMKAGKFAEALKSWLELPESLRRDKNLLMMRLQIAHELGERQYLSAINDFQKAFPDDPSLHLSLIDGCLFMKKYAEAQAAIDRVDKAVGGDPYLNVLRAGVLIEQQKFDEAKVFAQKTADAEPTLIDGHFTLLTIALAQQDHKETARLLRKLEKEFEMIFGDLTEADAYRHFVQSKDYADWMDWRRQK